MWQFWIVVSGVFFIGEIITIGFLLFWFAIAALIAMIVSLFIDNMIIQAAVFVISSGLLLFLTKPFINRFFKKDDENVKTNAYSIIGKEGIVLKNINSSIGEGQVRIGTEVWSAKSERVLIEGTKVEVSGIDGVKAIVEEIPVTNTF